MGEALITRRGGGGMPTKATDVSRSVVSSGDYQTFALTTSKMYLALLDNADDENGTVLIANGDILLEIGIVHGDYGISNGEFYTYDDGYQSTVYIDKMYLLE